MISIVTPSFNQARYVTTTINSIVGQDYPALDYVVVDGGSTDGSRDLIEQHSSHFSWWCSEPDGGMYAALNKGFAHTRGEIMGWLNSDDILLPGALHSVGEIFAQFPDVAWLSSLALQTWNPAGRCIGVSSIEGYSRAAFLDGGYLPGARRHYGWIPQESTFWRRSLWEKAGARLDDSLKLAGDFELWARFFFHAELVGTPTPIGGFRTHPAQKSQAMMNYLGEACPLLASAARAADHRPSLLRDSLLRYHVADIPGLRGPCTRHHGYSARRIVADTAGWRSENYRFL
jgi:glycosyltransferase involved in cell wall biosynthesis